MDDITVEQLQNSELIRNLMVMYVTTRYEENMSNEELVREFNRLKKIGDLKQLFEAEIINVNLRLNDL